MSIEWNADHAASGWRLRAFLPDGELIVYDEPVDWEVRMHDGSGANGREPDVESGKLRTWALYLALGGRP